MKRILYVFSFFLFVGTAQAQLDASIQAELTAQKEVVAAGKEFFLGLKMSLPKGWHVYWKNPGDAGESVSLKLDLPEGFKEVRRYWPAPKQFKTGYLTEYGYDREAWLLIKLQAPEKSDKGFFGISGRAVWLACRDECVPMAQDVSTLISVEENSSEFENPEMVKVINDLPQKNEDAEFFETSDSFVLSVALPQDAETAYFFAEKEKTLVHSASQTMKKAEGKAFLFMKKSPENKLLPSERLVGTLVFYNVQNEIVKTFDIHAEKTDKNLPVFEEPFVMYEFLTALIFAFLGGILLNLMPCVFPVLSLKAFRLLKIKDESLLKEHQKAGLSYTAGVVLSFVLIGMILTGLRSAGTELGWGFQLQYPPFVLSLCLFMFFLGLVFSDMICIGEKISAFSMNISRNWGDFGTGVVAVVAASPCAAPFMGTALGYGLMHAAPITISIFIAMGLGMSLPFLVLDFYPSLGRFLPKSGSWMLTFKNFLAFPLYGSAAWLLWVLTAQAGNDALSVGLICILSLSFWVWLNKTLCCDGKWKKTSQAVLFVTIILLSWGIYSVSPAYLNQKEQNTVKWLDFDADKVEEYRQANVPVFIKFSAKWCLTCLVNDKIAFSGKVGELFRQKGVVAFFADWTNRSDEITAALESFSRSGVPLYVYYAPSAQQPKILPQLLTQDTVLSLLKDL